MYKLMLSLVLLAAAPLQAQTPSDASIRELLALSKAQSLVDNSWTQIDSAMETAMQQALQGKKLSQEEQKQLADFRARALVIFKEEMSWGILEPAFIEAYRSTLSQGEVDSINEFYRSPAGQALVNKMPRLMEHSMKLVMERMQFLRPRLQALQEEMFGQGKDKGTAK